MTIVDCQKDPNSHANTEQVVIVHSHVQWTADFSSKTLRGSVRHDLRILSPTDHVVLDAKFLVISRIEDTEGNALEFNLAPPHETFGSALTINFGHLDSNATYSIVIFYETTEKSTAIQWLTPSQTMGKVHPYLFTQCQAIHARSIIPCQDTPGVKITYSAQVTVPKELRALMSAVPITPENPLENTYYFDQKIAIPSYLIALAVGDIVGIKVGPRSTVWSEPSIVKACAWEFEDTETFISIGESLLTPYCWGVYDLLVLPTSFPYGGMDMTIYNRLGMENPCLTFVTPSLLAGDRTLVDVVAHEIAHSWMGNLVTTKNWEHFWLNEGFTVFIERKIIGRLHGESSRHFNSIIGLAALQESVDHCHSTSHPEYSYLCPCLKGVDPDDVFSRVPYEKGFNFLFYLEQLVGGPEIFEPYVKAHVVEFSHKAITTTDFKEFLFKYFREFDNGSKLSFIESVDYELWFHGPGMPPVDNAFSRELVENCQILADSWLGDVLPTNSTQMWDEMQTNQRVMFFDILIAKAPLSHETLNALDLAYKLSSIKNSEVRFKWQHLCLQSHKTEIFDQVVDFITNIGRMKFVRPLYRSLFACQDGKQLARDTFIKHRDFYHPICATMVARDLGIA
ncbi:leukotriene A4 hydrolase [Globomyces pollinis-pini]|nr:leukotriene A4 hydrolase [Globomyces pollinis-pini]